MGADGGTIWIKCKKECNDKIIPWPLLSETRHGIKWELVPDSCLAAEYGTHLPFSLRDLPDLIYDIENLNEEQKTMIWSEYALDLYTNPFPENSNLNELICYLFLGAAWSEVSIKHEPKYKENKNEEWYSMKLSEWAQRVKEAFYLDFIDYEETWT